MNDGRKKDIQRIGGLLEQIDAIADPAIRAVTKDLVQSLMDLHGSALEKALEIVAEAGEPGMTIIQRLGHDPEVSSVLILYGLHPEDIASRVMRAVERVRPQLGRHGCELELVGVDGGAIRLRIEAGSHTCGSTANAIRSTLEEAIYDAAPDLTSLIIEGFEEKPASGFVALDKLRAGTAGSLSTDSLMTHEPQGTD